MEELFVPFELAVKLKDIGFDEGCFGHYSGINEDPFLIISETSKQDRFYGQICSAPLWQQVFDFFRGKHGYHFELFLSDNTPYDKYHYRVMQIGKYFPLSYEDFLGTYEETREAVIEKLIEIVANKK